MNIIIGIIGMKKKNKTLHNIRQILYKSYRQQSSLSRYDVTAGDDLQRDIVHVIALHSNVVNREFTIFHIRPPL